MLSSLKLSGLRGRKMGEGGDPPTTLVPIPSPTPVVTTNRRSRSHKWSIDRALCPGIGEKKTEDKPKTPPRPEANHVRQENINNNSNHYGDWDSNSYECTDDEQSNDVHVVGRVMNVSIERDASGSLGITLRGGAHPDPTLSRPLIITQVKPGGPADREGRLKVGDRLLSVDGHTLSGVSLSEAQSRLKGFERSPLSVLCVEYDVSVLSRAGGPLLVEIEGPTQHSLGLELVNTPDHSAVVIGHVRTGSIAERCGALLPGDQILAVNEVYVENSSVSAEDVTRLLWTSPGNSCLLQILPSSSPSSRGFSQPLYSCPSPSQCSKHSREHLMLPSSHHNHNATTTSPSPSPRLKRLHASSSPSNYSIQESEEVETNSGGVCQRQTLNTSLNCDAQHEFGLYVRPDTRLGVCIHSIEPRSPAERCGSLQVGDRVLAINGKPPPALTAPQPLHSLVGGNIVTLTVEFTVAQTVLPTSGVFTVKLANNKAAGLGITISGSREYNPHGAGMVISAVRPGSVAHRCGSLAPGDRLLSVNSHSLAAADPSAAADILHSSHDIVTLVVHKLDDEFGNDEGEGWRSVHAVEFCREGGPLGVTIAGSEDPAEPIVVSGLTPGGLAEKSQALQVGDQLLAIDSQSLSEEPLSTAIHLLQTSADRVTLCIARQAGHHSSRSTAVMLNNSVAREDLMGYSSPEIPSVDSAVESWDSFHEQSPPAAVLPSQNLYKSESGVRRKQTLQSCDSPILNCNTHWSSTGLDSTNSLNTLTTCTDADDTVSSFKLSETVLNDYTSQLIAQQKFPVSSPPCPLQVKYQHRNNTLPSHRRCSSIGVVKYQESVQANLLSSPRRCRRGFHLLEDEAVNFPLSEDLELSHPEVTFDTFFKRVTGPNREVTEELSKPDVHIFKVTLYKDPVYEDFGFSVSDGLYERGVFINRIRRGGPADASRVLQPYDRILQVNETKTEELDCCLTVPLVAAAGDKLQLTVCRGQRSVCTPTPTPTPTHRTGESKDYTEPSLPWIENEGKESQPLLPKKPPTMTKTL